MAEKKYLDDYGLEEVAWNVNKRLKAVTVMPENPTDNMARLFMGDNGTYLRGHVYQYANGAWADVTDTVMAYYHSRVYDGTTQEWGTKSVAEKIKYDYANFSDDEIASGDTLWVDGEYCKVRRKNGIVFCQVYKNAAVTLSNMWVEVAKVPAEFAPANEFNVSGVDNQHDVPISLRLRTTGAIEAFRNPNYSTESYTTSSITGTVVYTED
jgi:hypothetical protein